MNELLVRTPDNTSELHTKFEYWKDIFYQIPDAWFKCRKIWRHVDTKIRPGVKRNVTEQVFNIDGIEVKFVIDCHVFGDYKFRSEYRKRQKIKSDTFTVCLDFVNTKMIYPEKMDMVKIHLSKTVAWTILAKYNFFQRLIFRWISRKCSYNTEVTIEHNKLLRKILAIFNLSDVCAIAMAYSHFNCVYGKRKCPTVTESMLYFPELGGSNCKRIKKRWIKKICHDIYDNLEESVMADEESEEVEKIIKENSL